MGLHDILHYHGYLYDDICPEKEKITDENKTMNNVYV